MYGSHNLGLGMGLTTVLFALLIRVGFVPFMVSNVYNQ